MCESQADDRACTGSFETSACHQLSAGNSEQCVPEIGFASVGAYGGRRSGRATGQDQRADESEAGAHGWSYGTTWPSS